VSAYREDADVWAGRVSESRKEMRRLGVSSGGGGGKERSPGSWLSKRTFSLQCIQNRSKASLSRGGGRGNETGKENFKTRMVEGLDGPGPGERSKASWKERAFLVYQRKKTGRRGEDSLFKGMGKFPR